MNYFIINPSGYREPNWIKIILHSTAALILVMIVIWQFPLGTVGAGERGIQLRLNAATGKVMEPGLYFRIPFVEKVARINVQVQKEQVDASAASKDLQTVSSKVALNFHLDPSRVATIYKEVGVEYKERLIDPSIQEAVKSSTAKFTAEELITKREAIKEDVKVHLRERLQGSGIIVDEFNIVDFDFSPSFNAAIEAKVTAEQKALAAKNKLEQVKFEAEQAVVAANGKAKALQVESDAIRSNPTVLELRAIEKWNGVLPTVTSGAIPFININK